MAYKSKVDLNISQFPNTGDRVLDEALRPIHNALRLLQAALQGTDDVASSSSAASVNITELFNQHLIGHITAADIPESSRVYLTDSGYPDYLTGQPGDMWIVKSSGEVYVNTADSGWEYIGKLQVTTGGSASAAPMTWQGTWIVSKAYARQSVVVHPDTGAIYMALVNVPPGLTNKPPTASWLLLQEGTAATGEAVLSSRAPAPSGSPPNFVLSRVGSDLIYARI